MKKYFLLLFFLLNFAIEQKDRTFHLVMGCELKADSFGSEGDMSGDMNGDLPVYLDVNNDGIADYYLGPDGVYYYLNYENDVTVIGQNPDNSDSSGSENSGETDDRPYPDDPPDPNGNSSSGNSSQPDAPIIISIEERVKQDVDAVIRALDIRDFPEVFINQDPLYMKGNAFKTDEGRIGINSGYFNYRDNERRSILYHEYYHTQHDLPVLRVVIDSKTGQKGIFSIQTQEKIKLSAREIENIEKSCNEDKSINPGIPSDKAYKTCMDGALDQLYMYHPSNYFKNEIGAYNAQLEAAQNGTFPVEDWFLEEQIKDKIATQTDNFNRAIEYEKLNNYNPDGTKK